MAHAIEIDAHRWLLGVRRKGQKAFEIFKVELIGDQKFPTILQGQEKRPEMLPYEFFSAFSHPWGKSLGYLYDETFPIQAYLTVFKIRWLHWIVTLSKQLFAIIEKTQKPILSHCSRKSRKKLPFWKKYGLSADDAMMRIDCNNGLPSLANN